jgi:hypothetical protein
MKNPYTRLFLAIRIWEKSDDGCFGAAAVLWGKDEDGIISVRNAVDFGTRELTASAKSGFEVDDDDSMLPGVKTWTRPAPSPGHTSLRCELEVFDFFTIGIRPRKPTRTGAFYSQRRISCTRHRHRRQLSRCRMFSTCPQFKPLRIAVSTCNGSLLVSTA